MRTVKMASEIRQQLAQEGACAHELNKKWRPMRTFKIASEIQQQLAQEGAYTYELQRKMAGFNSRTGSMNSATGTTGTYYKCRPSK
jgi:hypothetical protein